MSFQKQLQRLQSSVRFMLQTKEKYMKSRSPEDFKKFLAAESAVKDLVFPKEQKQESLFKWLAQ